MLLAAYATAISLAVRMPGVFCAPVMIGGHAVLALALVAQVRSARRLRAYTRADAAPGSLSLQGFSLERAKYVPDAIQAFYRFIWTLFYSEYAMLPFL